MRRNTMIKFMAILLAISLCLPLLKLPSASATAEQVNLPTFCEGEVVYHPQLTGNGNGVPEGWKAFPETQVPWLNNGAAGGWANYDATNTQNGEIDTSIFTCTENGLACNLGQGDYGVVFPALVDSAGNPVVEYMFKITVSGMNAAYGATFGPVTDIAGGADYVGGTHLMIYDAGNSANSHRYYEYSRKKRFEDTTVSRNDANAIKRNSDGTMVITVYHCNNRNYYFVNDEFLFEEAGRDNYNGAPLNGIGLSFCYSNDIVIEDILVTKVLATGSNDALEVTGASVRYCDTDGSLEGKDSQGLRFYGEVDKTSSIYKHLVPEGTYDVANENVQFGMVILPTDMIPENGVITVDVPGVVDCVATKLDSQDDEKLTFWVSLLDIPEEQQDRSFSARLYVRNMEEGEWKYTYSMETITRTYYGVANLFYEGTSDERIKARLDRLFRKCALYEGSNADRMTFALFSDFHYLKGTYMTTIADMQSILDRANQENVDFIMHAGDFCNDYSGSPELMKTYLNNKYNIPALGVYGNHELESVGNSMQVVTPLLNNCNVVWGTKDGKIGDGSIAYFYYDVNGFRVICLDTNYSYNATDGTWEHNKTATSCPTLTNTKWHSLGPVQLKWLEETLMDAAEKDISCIINSHVGFSELWTSSPDSAAVRKLFAKANEKEAGTVMMAISGHIHTNHISTVDNVLYFDVNTAKNGVWLDDAEEHYTDETFEYIEYDSEGNPISSTQRALNSLYYGRNTWFFEEPLSAIVTISSSGRIVIEGSETDWISDLIPSVGLEDGQEPKISSGIFDIQLY